MLQVLQCKREQDSHPPLTLLAPNVNSARLSPPIQSIVSERSALSGVIDWRSMKKSPGVLQIVHIITVVVITQLYTLVKTHWTMYPILLCAKYNLIMLIIL